MVINDYTIRDPIVRSMGMWLRGPCLCGRDSGSWLRRTIDTAPQERALDSTPLLFFAPKIFLDAAASGLATGARRRALSTEGAFLVHKAAQQATRQGHRLSCSLRTMAARTAAILAALVVALVLAVGRGGRCTGATTAATCHSLPRPACRRWCTLTRCSASRRPRTKSTAAASAAATSRSCM